MRTIIIGSLVLTILLLYSYSEGGFYERIYYPTRKTPFRTHDVTYLSPDRLVYNRVPKCGTMTAVGIINVLSTRNNFTVISSPIYDHAELKTEGEQVGQALHSWSFVLLIQHKFCCCCSL